MSRDDSSLMAKTDPSDSVNSRIPAKPVVSMGREIRFTIGGDGVVRRTSNSWSGHRGNRLVPHIRLSAMVSANIDEDYGYVCDSRILDNALWAATEHVAMNGNLTSMPIAEILASIASHVIPCLPERLRFDNLEMRPSSFLRYCYCSESPNMIATTHQYEFSAAHRLHSPRLSAEENRRVYGKCNNPNGHGHNYVVDITFTQPIESHDEFSLERVDKAVRERVISYFDHKHLNQDCEEFTNLSPTVENLVIVIANRLHNRLPGCTLSRVRVYETPKTWAEYTC